MMLTKVPPFVFPEPGVIDVIDGRTYWNPLTLVTLVPLGFVTTIFTVPAACAGVRAEINVSLTDTFVAATPPNVTVAPWAKPDPLMDTKVPPPVFPELGLMDVIAGRTYVNPFVLVKLEPSGFVTTTLTVPAACAGVVAKIAVSPLLDTLVAATPPNVTVAPGAKPAPLIVTEVPPPVFPELGLTDVMFGRTYVNAFKLATAVELGLVTTTSTLPGICGGVVTKIDVSLTDMTVAMIPPNVTFAPEANPAPLIDMELPPMVVPELGLTDVIDGRTYVNPFTLAPEVPLGLVTTTFTLPAAWGASSERSMFRC
jgi:hypothetical protein